MDMQYIWLEGCKKIRDLLESWPRIEGTNRHDSLSPGSRNGVIIDRVLMNGVPALLQHSYLFGYNSVFSSSLLISIVSNKDFHGCVAGRFRSLIGNDGCLLRYARVEMVHQEYSVLDRHGNIASSCLGSEQSVAQSEERLVIFSLQTKRLLEFTGQRTK